MSKADELLKAVYWSSGVMPLYQGDRDGASQLLRDIVDTLGLSWEMVTEVEGGPDFRDMGAMLHGVDAIVTILEAAGVEP